MNEKLEFATRLKAAMVAAGLEPRPAVLEKQFNSHYWGRSVTFQAVSRWLNGHSIPSQEKLQVLAELLKVEPQALRYGEQAAKKVRERKAQWEQAINFQERETFEAFLSLPAAQKKVVREVILALAKAKA
jgi:transcriptional regulator with XRE-family HTH domain